MVRGVAVQAEGSKVHGELRLNKASRVVATYLQTQYGHNASVEECEARVEDLFNDIMTTDEELIKRCFKDQTEHSRYVGILTGVMLASIVRYGQFEIERGQIKKARLESALGVLAAAISPAPIAGGIIGGVITSFAGPIAEAAFDKKNLKPAILQMGAELEDRLRARPGLLDANEVAYQIEKTFRHCGIAY